MRISPRVAMCAVVATRIVAIIPLVVATSGGGHALLAAENVVVVGQRTRAALLSSAHKPCSSFRQRRPAKTSVHERGTISVISFRTRRVLATWPIGGNPDMPQVSPDGRQLWASNRFDGTVSVVDTRTGRVLHTIPVGLSPHGLCYFPNAGRVSLGHNGVYR